MHPLVRAHIEAERRLQGTASRAVGAAWRNLGSWNDADVERFLARAVPIVGSAQRQSVAVTDAFVARYLGRSPLGIDPEQITARTRKGTTLDEVYRRPFVQLWSSLKNGQQFDDGFNAALERAAGSAAMDVQLAMRETAGFIDREDSSFAGFQRVANAGACAFCQEVDGAFVSYEDVMALHNYCNCGVEPRQNVSDLPRQGELDVSLNDHGELGPMLGDPEHDFTAL